MNEEFKHMLEECRRTGNPLGVTQWAYDNFGDMIAVICKQHGVKVEIIDPMSSADDGVTIICIPKKDFPRTKLASRPFETDPCGSCGIELLHDPGYAPGTRYLCSKCGGTEARHKTMLAQNGREHSELNGRDFDARDDGEKGRGDTSRPDHGG